MNRPHLISVLIGLLTFGSAVAGSPDPASLSPSSAASAIATASSMSVGGASLRMSPATAVYFGGPDGSGPVLVIHADGRIITTPRAAPDDGAKLLLEALGKMMSTAYDDLREMDAALSMLDDSKSSPSERDAAKARIAAIRKQWAAKFRSAQPTPSPIAPKS